MSRKKFTHAQAIAVLKRYARRLTRFHESSDAPNGQMRAGFYVKGNFGVADDFFNAMRSLRRGKRDAQLQHDRERARLRP